MKKIRLSDSERANGETSYRGNRKYTIIRRPQHNGNHLVAAVDLNDGREITSMLVESKDQVRDAVHEVNRWMDKFYGGGPMSDRSRHRSYNKRVKNDPKIPE